MWRVAILAVYTALLVGALEWAGGGSTGVDPRHRLEGVIPGGVTTLTVTWALATLWVLVIWLHAASAPAPGLAVLGLYLVLVVYLDQWTRRVALPTGGGISPSEVWLYIAGGRGLAYAFGAALTVVVVVGAVRALRGR